MECMNHILAISVLIFTAQFNVNNCQPASSNDAGQGKEDELRRMLNTVLEQNKKLQQVWLGMEQMCKALSMPACDCEHINAKNQTTEPSPAPMAKRVLPLYVMSVKSSGTKDNFTSIYVKYVATPEHTTDWIVAWKNDGMWRTAGQRSNDKYDPLVYTSTVDVLHLEPGIGIDFWLYNNDESLSLRLNVTALETNQEQDVTKPYVDFLKIDKSFVAPEDTDLVISGIVNRGTKEFREIDYVEVDFIGVNTSASPPTTFEITQYDYDGLAVTSGLHNDTTSYFNITLRQPFVQYGGLLSVRMSFFERNLGLVDRQLYCPLVRIYGPGRNTVLQNNTIAMFPLEAQTLVVSLNHSILCAAMGNPRPEVSVFKMAKNGKKTAMAMETVLSDDYMNVKVMTLSASHPEQTEGHYLSVFDDTKTGLTKNSSQSIVISCKAKGSPKPQLQLKLYNEYGPDLVKSGMYKIRMSNPNKFTARVTLTISPIDDSDIHTVYCVSTQGGPRRSHEDSRPIYVYPGVQKNNYDLYERVFNATREANSVV